MILAKFPRPGAVKTRLATTIGNEAASNIAQTFLLDSVSRYCKIKGIRLVINASHDDEPQEFYDLFLRHGLPTKKMAVIVPKTGSMRGDILAAYTDVLKTSGKAVSITADTPHFSTEMIAALFKALGKHDLVFHPTTDGGASPHGMRKAYDLFSNMPDRSIDYMGEWLKRIEAMNLSFLMFEPVFDIDTFADLRMFYHWQCLLERSGDLRRICPRTLAFLKDLFV